MVNRPTEPNEIRFDLRRSERVHAQLPVVVQGKLTDETPFLDPTRAIVVSAHSRLPYYFVRFRQIGRNAHLAKCCQPRGAGLPSRLPR